MTYFYRYNRNNNVYINEYLMDNTLGVQLSYAWRNAIDNTMHGEVTREQEFKMRIVEIIQESTLIELKEFMNLITGALNTSYAEKEDEIPYFRNNTTAMVICQDSIQDELDIREGDWKAYG